MNFRNRLTLRHLRVIAELGDQKLVARVAETLKVSQPAVSKQIGELERIVGMPIVSRDRNRLFLTPVGLRLAEHARQVISQLDRAAFDIEAMASGVTGSVSIGVVSSVAPILLPDAIALFKRSASEAHPRDLRHRSGHGIRDRPAAGEPPVGTRGAACPAAPGHLADAARNRAFPGKARHKFCLAPSSDSPLSRLSFGCAARRLRRLPPEGTPAPGVARILRVSIKALKIQIKTRFQLGHHP